jgi:CheY-like chemotaxis protein
MRKILIAKDLKPLLTKGENLFKRSDVSLYFAASNDELLNIHVEHLVNLIITTLDLPGKSVEEIFGSIRKSDQLKQVSIIMACEPDIFHQERCKRSGANAVLSLPIGPVLLQEKIQQLLDIAPRREYRVVLNVAAEGKFRNRSFMCRTENISASGVLIKADADLVAGDGVSCSFFLPDGTKVIAIGEIVRKVAQDSGMKEKLYGVRYTHIAEDIQAKVTAYVRKREEEHRLAAALAL